MLSRLDCEILGPDSFLPRLAARRMCSLRAHKNLNRNSFGRGNAVISSYGMSGCCAPAGFELAWLKDADTQCNSAQFTCGVTVLLACAIHRPCVESLLGER